MIGSCLGSVKASFDVLVRPQPCGAVVAFPHQSHVPCTEPLQVSHRRHALVEPVPTPFTTDDHKAPDVTLPLLRLSWTVIGVSFLVLWKGILRLRTRLSYVNHDAPEHVCDATLI